MTLDEAVKRCEEVAKQQEVKANELYKAKDFEESRDCIWCSKEHEQLAEWLRKYQKIEQILDDYVLEAWEILEKIKEVVTE